MGIRLSELLAKVPEQVEDIVRDTQMEALDSLQRAMRNECRLVMRTPEEIEYGLPGARVPVHVVKGYPACLRGFQFPDDFLLSRFVQTISTRSDQT